MEEVVAAVQRAQGALGEEPPLSSAASLPRPRRGQAVSVVSALVVWTVLAAIVGIAVFIGTQSSSAPVPASVSGAPSASASASAAPAAPVAAPPDYGSRMSSNLEALAAYRAGVQSLRDAAGAPARASFEKAIAADPSFAAAYLRRALLFVTVDDKTRGYYQSAERLREGLGEHDLALLATLEPLLRVPRDDRLLEERLHRLTASDDPDFLWMACRIEGDRGHYALAAPLCHRASSLDETFAATRRLEAFSLLNAEDVDGALRAYDECLKIAPGATSCLDDSITIDINEGRCAQALELARRMVMLQPTSARPYTLLGSILLGMGEPAESFREALQQAVRRLPEEERALEENKSLAFLDVRSGDFRAARAKLERWQELVAKSTDESDHVMPMAFAVDLFTETKRPQQAAQAASTWLKQRSAWTPSPYYDFRIVALGALYRGGKLTRTEFLRERDGWFHAAEALKAPRKWSMWLSGFAETFATADDAAEALAALPKYAPVPGPFHRDLDWDANAGFVYLSAHRAREALPLLRRAARSCSGEDFFLKTWASYSLAEAAIEAGTTDATAEACDALRAVLARWGASTLPSATADRARRLLERLGCR
jgi:serine/threonine-protein kinase